MIILTLALKSATTKSPHMSTLMLFGIVILVGLLFFAAYNGLTMLDRQRKKDQHRGRNEYMREARKKIAKSQSASNNEVHAILKKLK